MLGDSCKVVKWEEILFCWWWFIWLCKLTSQTHPLLFTGGVSVVWPSEGKWRRCRHRGYRLQVGCHAARVCCFFLTLLSPDRLLRPFRLQEPGSLQRISSRRRKRPRISRQDTTESEDDGGRSHRSHRWNLRLSPDRTRSRTILEVLHFSTGADKNKSNSDFLPSFPRRAYRRSGHWSSVHPMWRSKIVHLRRPGAPDCWQLCGHLPSLFPSSSSSRCHSPSRSSS